MRMNDFVWPDGKPSPQVEWHVRKHFGGDWDAFYAHSAEKFRKEQENKKRRFEQLKKEMETICFGDNELSDYIAMFQQCYYDEDNMAVSLVKFRNRSLAMAVSNLAEFGRLAEQQPNWRLSEIEYIRFIGAYSRLKKRFPNLKRVHEGFLSSGWKDEVFPGQDRTFHEKGKHVTNRVAREGYDFHDHVKLLLKMVEMEETRRPVQRTMFFREPYRPTNQGEIETRKILEESEISALPTGIREEVVNVLNRFKLAGGLIDHDQETGAEPTDVTTSINSGKTNVVEALLRDLHSKGKQEKNYTFREKARHYISRIKQLVFGGEEEENPAKKQYLQFHDRLLAPYLRAGNEGEIESVIVGDTLSAFLNLDPELETNRCTAGSGIYRKVSYQYPFHGDIKIIDLCFNSPENKVAEVITIDTKDKNEVDHLLVETAEAGPEAYLLPDYEGNPAWTYLLLEEVIERAYQSGSVIVFSTNIDTKPSPNIFLATAAKCLGLAEVPGQKRYDPIYRGDLKWDEFLTTRRWEGQACDEFYLRKKLQPAEEDMKGTKLLPETYMGAWAARNKKRDFINRKVNGFRCVDGHYNMNNGCGLVRGFVYEVTKERYDDFKKKMGDVKTKIGLLE